MASAFNWVVAAGFTSRLVAAFQIAGPGSMSNLGTPEAAFLPKFIGAQVNQTLNLPWGGMNVTNTDPYSSRPDTGVTRTYDWTITRQTGSPDGVPNELLLINGQFPGPLVEANWGDWLEITVHNNIDNEGTAIHWHGTLQQESPWQDGVPGITQCPIAPGSTYTYRFKPDLYGTSWYHSHWESQYASGLTGPMVVYGPNHVDYDLDLGPVIVSDYFHEYYTEIEAGFLAKNVEVTSSDNNLINGKNSFGDNDAPLASFNFTSGKSIRLRLINPSAFAVEKISIDGHSMTVIANDFVPVQPYVIDTVTLAAGQRTDVVVQANGSSTDSIWLRAFKPPNCSPSKPDSNLALAAIFYENADRTQAPASVANADAYNDYCGNDPLSQTVPFFPMTPGDPDVTEIVPIELRDNGTADLWYMADRTFRVDYNTPQLLNAEEGNLTFPYIQNVHNYGSNNSLRFVIENPGAEPHPMHLHGHNFWVLQEGPCGGDTVGSDTQGDTSGGMASAAGIGPGQVGHGPPGGPVGQPGAGVHMNYARDKAVKRDGSDSGSGSSGLYGNCWDGSITNPNNPQRRDVQMLLPGHYMVIQWNQDNPGIWPLHCHIAWHVAAGFAWIVLERPDDIMKYGDIPSFMSQTCQDWDTWSSSDVVDQIGDGI
ncbi:hypothetical protein JX265_006165 [Neoarthrinium moseri]|uniref:Multicopper oxidase n=1 Tax=Neoarthrinium moseri TaxID=1658444 RepID=A0A9Q0AQW4_9PEZI|nr:hypothetical protein JX266_003282 [Neoarthrinium moseri]KAI1871125.1 hypothetical protein JX265_006165 [Neoarthrinium moseri]